MLTCCAQKILARCVACCYTSAICIPMRSCDVCFCHNTPFIIESEIFFIVLGWWITFISCKLMKGSHEDIGITNRFNAEGNDKFTIIYIHRNQSSTWVYGRVGQVWERYSRLTNSCASVVFPTLRLSLTEVLSGHARSVVTCWALQCIHYVWTLVLLLRPADRRVSVFAHPACLHWQEVDIYSGSEREMPKIVATVQWR